MEHDQRPGSEAPQADHIRFVFDPGTTLRAFAGQRRRFSAAAGALTTEELAAPSRCEGWTVADVLRHLVWVDATMHRLWSGDESMVAAFDPRVTPNEAVRADRSIPDEEIQRRYVSSTQIMAAELESAGPERFGRPSVSPAGQVPWWLSAVHIGWDSTIHERDALIPLGRAVEMAETEMTPCLAYGLVLASFFAGRDPLLVQIGATQLSRDGGPVVATALDTDVPERIGGGRCAEETPTVLEGEPVATIDAVSGRGSLREVLRGDAEVIDRLSGFARYFTARP